MTCVCGHPRQDHQDGPGHFQRHDGSFGSCRAPSCKCPDYKRTKS